jgi:hypothetical protein
MAQEKKVGWVMVYSTNEEYKIVILKGLLEEAGIKAYEIDKRDSNYLLGNTELYVRGDDVIRTKLIIEKSEL